MKKYTIHIIWAAYILITTLLSLSFHWTTLTQVIIQGAGAVIYIIWPKKKKPIEVSIIAPSQVFKTTPPDLMRTPPPPKKGEYFKYIIYGSTQRFRLIMGFSVNHHYELIPKEGHLVLVRGGGRIAVDDAGKRILFYGFSTDFGAADKQELIDAVRVAEFSPLWEGYTVYCANPKLIVQSAAWEVAEEICKIEI